MPLLQPVPKRALAEAEAAPGGIKFVRATEANGGKGDAKDDKDMGMADVEMVAASGSAAKDKDKGKLGMKGKGKGKQ